MGNDGADYQQARSEQEAVEALSALIPQEDIGFRIGMHESQGSTIGNHNRVEQNFYNATHTHHHHPPARQEQHESGTTPLTPEELTSIYREKLLRDPRLNSIKMPGMRGPIAVSDLYVHVRLHKNLPQPVETNPKKLKEAYDPLTDLQQRQNRLELSNIAAIEPTQALSHYRRCVVLGDPGAGKSTLLKQLALLALQGRAHKLPTLPIFLNLNEAAQEKWESLFDYILHSWEQTYGLPREQMAVFMEQKLNNGQAFFLLDALDETLIGATRDEANHSYRRVARAIDQLAQRFSSALIMVTTRKAGYTTHGYLQAFTDLEILDFLPHDIDQFILHWFDHYDDIQQHSQGQHLINDLKRNPRIHALAANPLLLSLIVLTYKSRHYSLPQTRTELYAQCVEMLLQRWDNEQRVERFHGLTEQAQRDLLIQIAAHFHQLRQRSFSELQLLTLIMHENNITDEAARQILLALSSDNGLLHENETGYYSFLHLTFQEYFTALDFKEHSNEIITHLGDPWWHEVILLLVPQLRDAGPLLSQLMTEHEQYPEDIFASKLVLAGQSLATGPRLRTYKEVQNEIPRRLFELMQNSQYTITRQHCAEVLAEIGNSEATLGPINAGLLAALKNMDEERRLDLLQGINTAGAPVLARPLLKMLRNGEFLWLAAHYGQPLETILSRLAGPDLLQDLITCCEESGEMLENITRSGVNLATVIALVGGETTIQFLLSLLKKTVDQTIAGWIPIALARTGHQSVIQLLLEGVLSENYDYMAGIIRHGDATIPRLLVNLLADQTLTTGQQRVIVMCLQELDDPTIQNTMRLALNTAWLDIEAKSMLAYTLFKGGHNELRDELVQRYICPPFTAPDRGENSASPDNAIKIEVLRAIGATHYTRALLPVQRLRTACDSENYEILIALGLLDDKTITQHLLAMIDPILHLLYETYELKYGVTTDSFIDAVLNVSNESEILALLKNRTQWLQFRRLIAQRLEETTRLFSADFFLQLTQMLAIRTMMSEVRVQIAQVIAHHADTVEVAQKLMEMLARSDIEDEIHTALYQVCRRCGRTVVEDEPGSAHFRLVRR